MARHENITLPKIHKNPTPEDKRKLTDDIRKGLVGYMDKHGNPQLHPK